MHKARIAVLVNSANITDVKTFDCEMCFPSIPYVCHDRCSGDK